MDTRKHPENLSFEFYSNIIALSKSNCIRFFQFEVANENIACTTEIKKYVGDSNVIVLIKSHCIPCLQGIHENFCRAMKMKSFLHDIKHHCIPDPVLHATFKELTGVGVDH